MIERTHDNLIQVHDNLVIHRYMDIPKFEKLLSEKSLFFCRVDKFDDPFEGAIPKKVVEYRFLEEKRIAAFYGNEISDEEAQKRADKIGNYHKRNRKKVIANCWMGTPHESEAMWNLYASKNGVVIQSKIQRLVSSLNKNIESIHLTKVRYIDYEADIWFHSTEYPHINYNLLTPYVHKRQSLRHEEEVRLFHEVGDGLNENYWDNQPIKEGKLFPVDINDLIEKIILSPTIEPQFEAKIHQLLTDYNLNFPVEHSALSRKPVF